MNNCINQKKNNNKLIPPFHIHKQGGEGNEMSKS